MFSKLMRLFRSPGSTPPRRARLEVEALEGRVVPAALMPVLGSDGNLWLEAPGWQSTGRTWLDGNVQSFQRGNDGYFYVLGTDGNLWQEPPFWQYWGRTWVDGNVQSFQRGSDGYDYVLGRDGNLWQELPGWQTAGRLLIDGNVRSFALGSDGFDYVLNNDGNLWRERPFTPYGGHIWVDGNVQAFARGSDGYDYVLSTDGNLWQELPGWQTNGRTWVDGNVRAFAHGSDGYDYVLGTDLNLWRELPGWWYYGRTWVDGNVWSFSHGSDGYDYVLGRDGNLWQEQPWWQYFGRTWVDGNARGFAYGTDGFSLQLDPHPAAATSYSPASGTLFGPGGPSYLDVQQGNEPDCWLTAGLAEVAARVPADIRNMFTYDGTAVENGALVGVYTARFYNSSGTAEYVTVDTELPSGGGYYDHPVGGPGAVNGSASPVLWVALAEKAYAEAAGYGFVTVRSNSNAYDALGNLPDSQGHTGGVGEWALQAITGQSASWENINPTDAVREWYAGQLIVLCTPPTQPPSSYILAHHYYALVNYNSSNGQFILFNPYGTDANGWQPGYSGTKYGLFWANAPFLSQNFGTQEYGGGGAPGGREGADNTAGGPGDVFAGLGAGGGLVNGLSAPTPVSGSTPILNEADAGRDGAGPGGGASNDATARRALTNSPVTLKRADGTPGIGGGVYALGMFRFDAPTLIAGNLAPTNDDDTGP